MTREEIQAKRDEILRDIDVASRSFGDRSESYIADKKSALAALDAELGRLNATERSTTRFRTTYAQINRA